ncbi:MAG: restriction endonuclease subunit S [Rikenellaceae bacterium]
MNKYEKYKDSGVAWIGEIPEHWEAVNVKRTLNTLTDFTANGSFADLAKNVHYLECGYSRLVRLTDLRNSLNNNGIYVSRKSHEYLAKSVLYGGEILLANVGAYAGLACVMPRVKYPATLGPNMFLLKFKNNIDNLFAHYSFVSNYLSKQLINKSISSAQPKLNKDNVKECLFIQPSIIEQVRIVAYLDWKCGEVDKVVAVREEQIKLLGELRTSIISRAVTKGLNPDAPLKDSGIAWIGSIPAHWDSYRFKFTTTQMTEASKDANKIGLENIESGTGGFIASDTVFEGNGIGFIAGDIVYGKLRPYLQKVWLASEKGNAVGDFFVYRTKSNSQNRFIQYFMLSDLFTKVADGATYGAKMPRVGSDFIANFPINLPPIDEQQAIANYLDKKTAEIDSTIAKYKEQVAKLKEYRQALITEVVTGKIDVRDVVIPKNN